MAPAFARRTPQQPLTSSGRPKRATILKKEAAAKEQTKSAKGNSSADDDKPLALLQRASQSKAVEKGGANKKNAKQGNTQKASKGANRKTKAESEKDDDKSDISEKETESSDKGNTSGDQHNGKRESTRTRNKKKKDSEADADEVGIVEEEPTNEIIVTEEDMNAEDSQEEASGENSSVTDPDDGELDDDEDKDFDPDDDPEKLWCFCKKPHGNRFMICCDSCEDWFHGDCIGISMDRGREMEKTGEEWCCGSCKEKKDKAEMKKANAEKNPLLNSPLNTPLDPTKLLDSATITKARSLSLDSMKSNLAKSLKNTDKTKRLSTDSTSKEMGEKKPTIKVEEKTIETIKSNVISTEKSEMTPEKSASTKEKPENTPEKPVTTKEKEKDVSKHKRRESNKQEFRDLLTFDHFPKKEDVIKKEETAKKRTHERHDSQSSEDDARKRKKDEIKKTLPSKVRSSSTSKPVDPPKSCVRKECNRPVMKGAIYCSRECIYKFANECIKLIDEEKKKSKDVGKPPDIKQESSKGTVICPATSSTDRVVTETNQERIAVFEKSTGKVVAGVMAPTKKYLFAWLEEHPTYEVLKPGKQPADIKNSKNQDEVIRSNVRKSLRDILVTRCKETEMAINHDVVVKLSKRIESELLKMFNETSQKYKTKYRSLIFNLKDRQNKILYKRVVSGEISPRKLVQMSPEQLATPELAQWRQQENKHHLEMVKKREVEDAEIKKLPALKKTHKGEVERDDGTGTYDNLEIKAEPVIDRKPPTISPEMENLLKDTTEEHTHHLFDSNCKICTGKVAPRGESTITGVSTTVIQAVPESSVPSPLLEDMETYGSSPQSPDTSEITSPVLSPAPRAASLRKQPLVWRGFVTMQKVAKFVCSAYAVSGTCDSLMDILPDTIHVCGRIPPNQVWDYLGLLREGRNSTNKYLDVIRFEMSSDEEKSGYIKLYTYFYTRQRIGVIGNCYSGIKDIYILPLASHDPIPPELRPLPGLPKPRPHMLLGIIVRVKSRKVKVSDFSVDSSPEVVAKKKKKKREKKKEKELEKEAEKEKAERDLEREKAEIVLERERVELEAQKKLIDIIFQNRANEAFPQPNIGYRPDTMMQPTSSIMPFNNALMAANVQGNIPQGQQLFQPNENFASIPVVLASQSSTDIQMKRVETNNIETMSEDHRKIEEEQLQKLKEQQREILKLQTEVGTNFEQSEVVLIPDPESIAKNMRENVLNQITEAIQDVSESRDINEALQGTEITGSSSDETHNQGIKMETDCSSSWESNLVTTTTNATEVMSPNGAVLSSDEASYPSEVESIVSLININASLAHPLKPEEKNPIFQAWLESSTKVKPVGPSLDQSQIDTTTTQVPGHTSLNQSHTHQVQLPTGLSSASSSIDTGQLQTILSSIASSVAQDQSISASHSISQLDELSDSDSNSNSQNQSLNVPYSTPPISIKRETNHPSAPSSIKLIYSSPTSIGHPSEFSAVSPASLDNRDLGSSSPYSSSDTTYVGNSSKAAIHSHLFISSAEASQSSSSEEEQRQKSDDDYAIDLIEDIPIPRRATLFSMDLIKMRAGIKMPELPDIKLPEKPVTNVVAIPPPPIPSSIPQVPIPPDIKLPPGVPFPPLPPPPPSSSNTLTIRPEDIEDPVEDIRTQWNKGTSQLSIDNSRFIRSVSTVQTSIDSSRFNRPVSSGSIIFSKDSRKPIDLILERLPFSDSVPSKPILAPQGMDIRACLPPRDTSRDTARDIRMPFSAGIDNNARLLNKELIEDIEESHFGEDPDRKKFTEEYGPRKHHDQITLRPKMFRGDDNVREHSIGINQNEPPGAQLKPFNPRLLPEPMFRGMRPPIQIIPVPGQGPRLPPPRLTVLPQCNRFEPPVPSGPLQMNRFGLPMPPGPMQCNRFGPPVPGGPMQRNPFPPPVPPGPMLGNRFPLGPPPCPPEGNYRPPFGHLDLPLMRNDNPTNFDIRKVRPPFQESRIRGRDQHSPGEQLFDVPRPRKPLDPHLRPDRPDCMPPPFHSQRPPFRPENPTLSSSSSRTANQQPTPHDSDKLSRPVLDEEYEEKFDSPEFDRRNRPRERKHERYDRGDREFNRNNRGDKGFQKNRQGFHNFDRHSRYEGKRDSPRPSSGEFRYREKNNEERDRYDSKPYARQDWPPNNRKRSPKANKYAALTPDELEEGEVL